MTQRYPSYPHERIEVVDAHVACEGRMVYLRQRCRACGATQHLGLPTGDFLAERRRVIGGAEPWHVTPAKMMLGAGTTEVSRHQDVVEAVFEFLDNREYELEPGLWGRFKVDWQSRREIWELHFEPYRWLPAYRQQRRQMGDDWSTDLTNSERTFGIAAELGLEWLGSRETEEVAT